MEIPLGGLSLPLDHVAFAVHPLEDALARLRSLELSHTPTATAFWPRLDGPRHARTVSVMFDDGYLDIIEYAREDGAESELRATGVVLRATDLGEVRSQLGACGVACGEQYLIARCFEGDEPDQQYEIFPIGARHGGGLPLAVIRTDPAAPMRNLAPHGSHIQSVVDGARRLGVEL